MIENIPWPVFGAIAAVAVFMLWRAREDGKNAAKLKQAQVNASIEKNVQAQLEKQHEKAEAAKSVGGGNTDAPVTSVGLSDAEFESVFGYKRPHSNS